MIYLIIRKKKFTCCMHWDKKSSYRKFQDEGYDCKIIDTTKKV